MAIAALMLLSVTLAGFTAPRQTAALSCGPCPATATDDLNLRAGPGLDEDVLQVIPAGAELEWDQFQGRTNGFVAVNYDGTDGWAYAAYLILFPTFATTADRLNLRDDPSLSADVLTVMPSGAQVTVLSGPTNGFFSVQFDQRLIGWAHGDYLAFGGTTGDYATGDEVVVATDALNLRAGPGLGEDVVTVLFEGASLVVQDGPESADGYLWYEVDTDDGTGWVAGAYLAAA
jgi:N-acetylmuramoyl-L-alanine amidase